MNENEEYGISWKTCIKLAISALVVFLLVRYWGAIEGFIGLLISGLLAIFVGLTVAYVANIPMRFFENKLPGEKGDGTKNRLFALVLTIVCVVAVLLIFAILVIPQLVNAAIKLSSQIPALIDAIKQNEFIASLLPAGLLDNFGSIDWQKMLGEAGSWLQTGVVSSLPQITSIIGTIGACGMGIILAFWFLADKDRLSSDVHLMIRSYISQGADERFTHFTEVADECFRSYFGRQFLEGVIFGMLVAIPCAILGIPNPAMLGTLVGVMYLIPMVGPIIGAVLGAIIVLASSWQQALIFLVVFFIVQQIEANFIYPRFVGKHVGLYGMWPLIGITLGVTLFGFVGAFIGVPITATIFRMVDGDLRKREESPDESSTPLEKLQKSLSDK